MVSLFRRLGILLALVLLVFLNQRRPPWLDWTHIAIAVAVAIVVPATLAILYLLP